MPDVCPKCKCELASVHGVTWCEQCAEPTAPGMCDDCPIGTNCPNAAKCQAEAAENPSGEDPPIKCGFGVAPLPDDYIREERECEKCHDHAVCLLVVDMDSKDVWLCETKCYPVTQLTGIRFERKLPPQRERKDTPGDVLLFIGSRFGHHLVGRLEDDSPMTKSEICGILEAAQERFGGK